MNNTKKSAWAKNAGARWSRKIYLMLIACILASSSLAASAFGQQLPVSLAAASQQSSGAIAVADSRLVTAAQSSPQVTATDVIALTNNQTDFSFTIKVDNPTAYAGVELAIQCPENLQITAVNYSRASSVAGPTTARGLVWFSTFAGNNAFAGTLTATVQATYQGERNTQIVIDHAALYAIDGSNFSTSNVPLRTAVNINREGASNTPLPLDPPPSDVTAPGRVDGGNPAPGAVVSSNRAPVAGTAAVASAVGPDTAAAAAAAMVSDQAANIAGNQTTTIPQQNTPLTANSITEQGSQQEGLLIGGLVIAFLLAVAALWCLLIRRRRRNNDYDNDFN